MSILIGATWLLAAFILIACAYRATFVIAYFAVPRMKKVPDALPPPPQCRFAVIIPAHDEELLIGDVLGSLGRVDYPPEFLRMHVIADNCSDRTAERARELGATVFERNEPRQRGKGQALAWVLERIDLEGFDAVAFFDADNLVSPNFFDAMNRELARGARCLQGYYGISNPNESTMTRLLSVTYVMKNLFFNAGKSYLGLSVSLMGTGITFHRDVVERYGWKSMTIGEDLEQTLQLLESGEPIRFVPDALTLAQEASSLGQGYSQRQRWASGRSVLAGHARRAILRGIRNGALWQAELGFELLMPSYSKLLNWTLVAGAVSLVLADHSPLILVAVALALAYQLLEVLLALRLMEANWRTLGALFYAPIFLVWKAGIDLMTTVGYRPDAWVRTDREEHPDAGIADSAAKLERCPPSESNEG